MVVVTIPVHSVSVSVASTPLFYGHTLHSAGKLRYVYIYREVEEEEKDGLNG